MAMKGKGVPPPGYILVFEKPIARIRDTEVFKAVSVEKTLKKNKQKVVRYLLCNNTVINIPDIHNRKYWMH